MPAVLQPYVAAVQAITLGETRTYDEVAVAAGKGPSGSRQVGKMIRRLDLQSSTVPWWRVVAADGSLIAAGRALRTVQLQALQNEGARPMQGESVVVWCAAAGCHVIGCYSYKDERMVFADVHDARVHDFCRDKVERFRDAEAAAARGFVRLATAELSDS
ncbi:hypothetical protein ABPG75_007974 [Micractinium tetrahymenae]